MDEQAERVIRDAQAFTESIIDTVRDPLVVLDGDLRVVRASPEFYRTFGVTPGETEGRLVYELGDGQWDIPALRHLLDEVLPRDAAFDGFEVEHDFPSVATPATQPRYLSRIRAAAGTAAAHFSRRWWSYG